MDIRQLETFVWIARLGSVTAACERLNVTQSTLSMRLKALESDLRVMLFDRAHKQLKLTSKGRDLLPHAESIVGAMQQVRMHVADPTAEFGTLRIGMSEFVAMSWGAELLRRFSEKHPKVLIELEVGLVRGLLESMDAGQLDVLLAPVPVTPDLPLKSELLGRVEYSWMASPALGLHDKEVTPLELKDVPIVSYDGRKSLFFPAVTQWFSDNHVPIHRITVCNSLAVAILLIIQGLGIGILPTRYCARYEKEGKLKRLKTAHTVGHDYYAMYHVPGNEGLPSVLVKMAKSAFADHMALTETKPPRPGRR